MKIKHIIAHNGTTYTINPSDFLKGTNEFRPNNCRISRVSFGGFKIQWMYPSHNIVGGSKLHQRVLYPAGIREIIYTDE